MIPLSNTPSITNRSMPCRICSSTSGYTSSFIYTSTSLVFDRTPAVSSSTFRSVLRILFRIRAVLVFTDSVNPSFDPRSTFSVSVVSTEREGYPLLPIFSPLSYPSTRSSRFPASIASIASSLVGSGSASESPRLFASTA